MKEQWSAEQANQWYARQPWLRGCNFIGSDCANRFDMWQSYHDEEHLATADRELALCHEIGFNTVRIWLIFEAYYQEPEHFLNMVERYLQLCEKHEIRVMFVLAHEEFLPRGDEFYLTTPVGEQSYVLGYHQGIMPPNAEEEKIPPRHYFDYPQLREPFLQMVRSVVKAHANDERVLCWNIVNEPGGAGFQDRSSEMLRVLFAETRAQDPIQPLTADIWHGFDNGRAFTPAEETALELSDVISFHSYDPTVGFVNMLKELKDVGRPVLCTEWLHRIKHNDVAHIYPLLYLENVAGYCWGFVLGKTQTQEPWNILWDQYDQDHRVDYDFTKWQHDLFRPNLRPYDPHEIEIIRQVNAKADERFARQK